MRCRKLMELVLFVEGHVNGLDKATGAMAVSGNAVREIQSR